jgi:GNAT superfamily N-acetyltransferase
VKYLIAALKPADRSRWLELWSAYQQFYKTELPTEATDTTWTRLHNGRIGGFGARDDSGNLVGIVHFLFHEDTWSPKSACYLQDLFVDSTARGHGCARQLIESVATAAKSAGANLPYWLTHETNTTARKLYDKVASNPGFIQYVHNGT